MKNKVYDIILAGGGAAGLSLALHISRCPELQHLNVLLIDKDRKESNDRTWCFWTDKTDWYDEILYKSWQNIRFKSPLLNKKLPLKQLTYKMLRGIDFYRYTLGQLRQNPRFKIIQGTVQTVADFGEGAVVTMTDGTGYQCGRVFDSRVSADWLRQETRGHNLMLQHFLGWEIEAESPVFEQDTIQMFDFNIPQHNEVRFVYILPFSPTRALVEFTVFSAGLLPQTTYETQLKDYVDNHLQLKNYQITDTEKGVIPMTDYVFPRQSGRNVINIGTRGGACKASTGYAFLRMQRDARHIVEVLKNGGTRFDPPGNHARYHFYDAMILNLMRTNGGAIAGYFTDLFGKNPPDRVLRFLDEQTCFAEELLVMASVPPLPFINALGRVAGKRFFRPVLQPATAGSPA